LPREQQRIRIEEMLEARRPSYEAAQRTLNADRSVENVVTDLAQLVADPPSP
jgi:shikimate kinase